MFYRIKTEVIKRDEIEFDCGRWAREISKEFRPDLIIFIAKSGFLFAKPLSDYWNCRLAEISASRPSNKKKDDAGKLIKAVPTFVVLWLLKNPLNYFFHDKHDKRDIICSYSYKKAQKDGADKILIVDDSVDTGWTMDCVYRQIKRDFKHAEVKTASYSVIQFSKKRININYYRKEDTIALTATSRKSDEYEKFLSDLDQWRAINNI